MHGIPFLNCNAVFPLLERPVAAQDTPMVSLGYVFQPVPGIDYMAASDRRTRHSPDLANVLWSGANVLQPAVPVACTA